MNTFHLRLFILMAFLWIQNSSLANQIYLAPDDHTDYMWSANEETYEKAFLTMIDYYLDQIDATQADSPPHQARWNADGSLWMWIYQKNRTQAQFQRLIDRIKDGHFSMPLNALVLSNGGTPAEAVLRGMYYPGIIQRNYNLDFPIAISMENQTLPYGLSSLWVGSGAKYSWKGVCGCSSHVPHLSNREREIYYVGGRDDSRLLMKWNSLLEGNNLVGGYAEGRNPYATINFVENSQDFKSRYPFPIIGIFGKGEDDLMTTDNVFVAAAKNMTNNNRQVIVSNQLDFFKAFEAKHGNELETYAASYGNEWELYSASMSEVSAQIKRAIERLRAAEAMATLVAFKNPSFWENFAAERDKAMLNFGLYYEHNWTADGRVSRDERAEWQRKIAFEITSYVNNLYYNAKIQLGRMISLNGNNKRFYVFNSLGWARTDYVDFLMNSTDPIHVVDLSTGLEVPSQLVISNSRRWIRILASNIPSVGYKVFEVRPGAGAVFNDAATIVGNTIENSYYKLTVSNSGAITSIIDKTQGNREFVRNINGLNVNDLGGTNGRIVVENVGAVTVTLRINSTNPYSKISRITLIRDVNRIAIQNVITQNFADTLTWGFSFNIDAPNVWHEEVGAVIRANLLPNGGHYSPKNARYDWLTINHFADVSNKNLGITLSNADAYYMKLGHSTHTQLDANTPQLNILAGGQVDGPGLGIPNQGGDTRFTQRFALKTHGSFNQTEAMKFSLEHQNPLVADRVLGSDALYGETQFSLATISDPDILLWALKPSEQGISQGIITRVWNQSNSPKNYTLSLASGISSGKRVSHIETDVDNATIVNGILSASIKKQQIQTHRLQLRKP